MLRYCLWWLLFVCPVIMAASDETMEHLFQMSLEELLEVRITSATRHEESLVSVPASVTVYTREQLRVLGINNLTQLMNFVPGFQSQRFDNASESFSFSSRGYAGSGAGREVLILLDGQRLNSDWSGGVFSSHGLIDLDKMPTAWQEWGQAVNINNVKSDRKLTFSHYDAALQAAEQGLGLALALLPIENLLLERHLLIKPFNEDLPYYQSVYAVYREEDKDRHDIQCFINWLIKSPNLK